MKSKLNFNKIYESLLYILFIIGFNNDWRLNSILWYGTAMICFAFFLFKYKVLKLDTYSKWLLIFFACGATTIIWSIDKSRTFDFILASLSRIAVLLPINIYFETEYPDIEERAKKIVSIIIFALLVTAVYLFIILDWRYIIAGGTLGVASLTKYWASNAVGAKFGVASFIALYFGNKYKKYYLVSIPFVILTVLSGSKGGILAFIIPLIFSLIVRSNNPLRALKNIILTSILLALVIYISLNNKFLFHLVGRRFQNLYLGLSGETALEGTTQTRELMIQYGLSWFMERPIFGFGANCYYTKLSEVFRSTYSHNTYIELLVGTGVVGTLVYYSIYYRIFKYNNKIKNTYFPFVFAMLLSILIHNYVAVDYNDLMIQLTTLLCFLMCRSTENSMHEQVVLNETSTYYSE